MNGNTTDAPEMQTAYKHPRPASRHMTFKEFLTLDDEATMSEWIDGEVIFMSPAAERHQDLILFLAQTLGLFVQVHNLGRILLPPFVMKIEAAKRGREPDLIFVSRERMHLIQRTYLNGPADLAVEIISPDSIERDRRQKFVEYEQAGVKEYWLMDPDSESAEFFALGADRRYQAVATPDGIFRSQVVPGFFIRLAWLWQTPSPTLEALRELKLF